MNPFTFVSVKTLAAGGAAALLTVGAAGVIAQAASPSHGPNPATSAKHSANNSHRDRHAIRRAVIEAEADVLGIKPDALIADMKAGQRVSDLAGDRGMTKKEFETRLVAVLRPRLEVLVDRKVITQAQADRVLDHISKGDIPFWNGRHRRK